jgi:carboxyl-terminal processing protease
LKGVTPDVVIPDRYEFFKVREKDNESALSWDEISKADYHPWVSTYSTDAVINAANEQVNTSSTFRTMKQQIEWIDKKNDKEVSLNLAKYRSDLVQMKAAYKQLDSLYKLPKEMTVLTSATDTAGFANDKDKLERNKQFLNRVKGDVYIDETVKVMNNMINQTNIAVNATAPADASKKN